MQGSNVNFLFEEKVVWKEIFWKETILLQMQVMESEIGICPCAPIPPSLLSAIFLQRTIFYFQTVATLLLSQITR